MLVQFLHKGIVLILLFSPISVFGAVTITEIMYDPEGSDTDHEWVEVYNDGASEDLSGWKFFEGGSNHGLTLVAGSAVVSQGWYAIIAVNAPVFLADYPSFSGTVFDSVFSGGLNNTNGETLTMRNSSLVDVDTVSYSPSSGANGDGNSLQKVGSSWTAASPTPGAGVSGGGQNTQTNSNTNTNTTTTATTTQITTLVSGGYPVDPQIRTSAGDDRTVTVGAASVFEAKAFGIKGEPLTSARFLWSFGNGARGEGKSVLYAFPYPGKYVVVLDASSGEYSATDRITVTAVPAKVSITGVTSEFVEISNRSSLELDLGLWMLSSQGVTFIFPRNTILLPNEKIMVSNNATGLSPQTISDVSLLYPNGVPVSKEAPALIVGRGSVSPSTPTTSTRVEPTTVEEATSSDQVAAAFQAVPASTEGGGSGMLLWVVAVIAVAGLGVAAVFLMRKPYTTGYTIIEEKE